MGIKTWKQLLGLVFILGLIFTLVPPSTVQAEKITPSTTFKTVEQFASSLSEADSTTITGLYVKDTLALNVIQQAGRAYFVSSKAGSVTQFSLASQYGSIGMLAHNYLAGSDFPKLTSGTVIALIFGDGSIKNYKVSEIRSYQALSPTDPYSKFVNLSSGDTLSSTEVFKETYGISGALVLQTCIEKNDLSSWGRLFIIATAEKEVG